eukprot:GHVR01050034.1.p1 GENE.GHVR01050034.1~~GHVR01050034.1.p1  ORF type:complete len:564 (-),score=126.53 GHVR01050034.1:638-2329(-)
MKSGFLKIQNRLIVALSRAKHGLYIVGDGELLADRDHSGDWSKVLFSLHERQLLGLELPLGCQKHPHTRVCVSSYDDFERVATHGGCSEKCKDLLEACGHVCPLSCHPYSHEGVRCARDCVRPRPSGCQHKCTKRCHMCKEEDTTPSDVCPTPCTVDTQVFMPLPCGHSPKYPCHMITSLRPLICNIKISKTLSCGHTRTNIPCSEQMSPQYLKCNYSAVIKGTCGHNIKVKCHTRIPCSSSCDKVLGCGHMCPFKCGDIHVHDNKNNLPECVVKCSKYLMCGHKCGDNCSQPCTSECAVKCHVTCVHGYVCGKKCFDICTPCNEPCGWRCTHYKCTKRCHDVCNRPVCNHPCPQTLLCGHRCVGVCGEPCPPCHICESDINCSITLCNIGEIEEGEYLYTLPDCGHTFYLEGLDSYFENASTNEGHVAVKIPSCPFCRAPVYKAGRYNKYVKNMMQLINKVKEKTRRNAPLTTEERREIDAAMRETGGTVHGNHWFACSNGHPYFIGDCGGAAVVSTCPECGVSVGGTNHALVEGNQTLNEFTGVHQPHAFGHNFGVGNNRF